MSGQSGAIKITLFPSGYPGWSQIACQLDGDINHNSQLTQYIFLINFVVQ